MEAGGGSFCQLLERTIAQICQPFSATRSMENGCVLLPVEGSEGILLPPVQHDPVLSVEDPAGRGRDNFNSSILAKSALVPGPNGNDGGDTQASLPQRETAYIPNGRPASADEELINQTNRMEALRISLESRGLPKNVIELLLGQQDSIHNLHINQRGTLGTLGVSNGVSIPCLLLSTTF